MEFAESNKVAQNFGRLTNLVWSHIRNRFSKIIINDNTSGADSQDWGLLLEYLTFYHRNQQLWESKLRFRWSRRILTSEVSANEGVDYFDRRGWCPDRCRKVKPGNKYRVFFVYFAHQLIQHTWYFAVINQWAERRIVVQIGNKIKQPRSSSGARKSNKS